MSTAVARSFPRSKATEENRVGGRKASKPALSHTAKKQVSGSGEGLSFLSSVLHHATQLYLIPALVLKCLYWIQAFQDQDSDIQTTILIKAHPTFTG